MTREEYLRIKEEIKNDPNSIIRHRSIILTDEERKREITPEQEKALKEKYAKLLKEE